MNNLVWFPYSFWNESDRVCTLPTIQAKQEPNNNWSVWQLPWFPVTQVRRLTLVYFLWFVFGGLVNLYNIRYTGTLCGQNQWGFTNGWTGMMLCINILIICCVTFWPAKTLLTVPKASPWPLTSLLEASCGKPVCICASRVIQFKLSSKQVI